MSRTMLVYFLAKLARVAMELIECAGLCHTPLLRASLSSADVLAPDTGVAVRRFAQRPRRPVGVRRDACSLPPERSVLAGVEADLRVERQGDGATP